MSRLIPRKGTEMVFERIRELICRQFDLDPACVTPETSFLDDLQADSLDVVELAMTVEETFGLPEIREEDIKTVVTVEDLVNYVTAALDK